MPIRRNIKNFNERKISPIEKKIDDFASKAEIYQDPILDKDADPILGMTIKLNKYEHSLLKKVAKKEGRSMQKQMKRILITELEKCIS